MMDTALSLFNATLRSVSMAAVRGDRVFFLAIFIPFVILLFIIGWDLRLFIFLGLAYSSALLGFMVARSMGAFAQKAVALAAPSLELKALQAEKEKLKQTIRHLTLELSLKEENAQNLPCSAIREVQSMMASHELKEPLRTVRSFIQLLHDRHLQKLDKEGQDFIHFIGDGARRMEEMIDNVRTFSSIGETAKTGKAADLNFIAGDVLRLMGARIREAKAIIQIDQLPELQVDPQQFSHLLQNLIDNALKYCEAQIPMIHLHCEQKANQWIFRLKDNGIGIEKEYHKVVFDLFRRLHGVGVYSGSGIGLAICKRIVENHEGKIWIESEGRGKGSIVCICI